ncbi:hypothetical protein NDU88_006068 [Pleurodeles waltl]|uniref:Secreted protein n=1 Tax=Pleurodeles waltl TaxID=8319 RepID=A0AAV7RNI4_PLEWA|nr:hypothetical protein NDU88_006068 [Pleurodeles waltl]
MPCPAPSGWRVLLGLVVPPGARSQVQKMPRGVAACFVAPAMPCPAPSGWRVLLGLVVPPGAGSQVQKMLRGVAARFVAPAMPCPAPSGCHVLIHLALKSALEVICIPVYMLHIYVEDATRPLLLPHTDGN